MAYLYHGMTHTSEYGIFAQAKARCTNHRNAAWKRYGGRGIKFRYASVLELVADVGRRPSQAYSLDRMNNEGNYEAGNCRWATRSEQAYNRAYKLTNADVLEVKRLGSKGWTHKSIAEMKGVNQSTITRTINGERNALRHI